jgi:hypothetical protein
MDFTKDTLVKDILAKYPDLKAKLIKMDPKFKILDNPLAAAMISKATLADVSVKAGMDVESLIAQLKTLI